MSNKVKVVVLASSRYDFKTNEGQELKGAKVYYAAIDKSAKDNFIGHKPQEATMDIEIFDFIKDKIPAICDMEFTVDLSTKTPTVKVTDFDYIAPVQWYASVGSSRQEPEKK